MGRLRASQFKWVEISPHGSSGKNSASDSAKIFGYSLNYGQELIMKDGPPLRDYVRGYQLQRRRISDIEPGNGQGWP